MHGYVHYFVQGGTELSYNSKGPSADWLYCKIDIDEAEFTSAFGNNATKKKLLMLHEMGHVFGLNHTDDKTSVMYPSLLTSTATKVTYSDSAALIQKLRGV